MLTRKLEGGQRARCLNLRFGEVCADFCAVVVNDKVKVMAMEVCCCLWSNRDQGNKRPG